LDLALKIGFQSIHRAAFLKTGRDWLVLLLAFSSRILHLTTANNGHLEATSGLH